MDQGKIIHVLPGQRCDVANCSAGKCGWIKVKLYMFFPVNTVMLPTAVQASVDGSR